MNNKISSNFIFKSLLIAITFSTYAYAATCPPNITQSSPDTQFSDNNDGTVTDNKTKLMWARCDYGVDWSSSPSSSCIENADDNEKTWDEAFAIVNTANANNFGMHSDWRLPNIKELQSLVERSCYLPAINDTVFSVVDSNLSVRYWTSTPSITTDDSAWTVDFSNGLSDIESKDSVNSIRLVRNSTP